VTVSSGTTWGPEARSGRPARLHSSDRGFPRCALRRSPDDNGPVARDAVVMRILVAYASKRGATAEIAHSIAWTLRDCGADVDCTAAAGVPSVAPYDAVVLGSAVYMKRWRAEARRFLRKHAGALAERPLWVFSSGPTGPPAADKPAWTEPRRTIQRAERLGARDHVVFGGRVPADAHGPAARAMANGTPAEYRDRRDWDGIRAWAHGIAAALGARVS